MLQRKRDLTSDRRKKIVSIKLHPMQSLPWSSMRSGAQGRFEVNRIKRLPEAVAPSFISLIRREFPEVSG